jgi:hypothetical protein
VNGDPDVDAIYRLTRKHNARRLNVTFDEYAPPLVLKPFQYAPINSQNTLYHYDAFWTMAFPLQVTFRECDILRGYIAMRMLQEIDGRVAFIPPNTVQLRNAHSYHADYKDEKRLYEDVQGFVRALHEWRCVKATIFECYIDCVNNLIQRKFLKKIELNFVRLWIDALNSVRYKWPSLFKLRKKVNLESYSNHTVLYSAVEQARSSNANENEESVLTYKHRLARLNYTSEKCQSKLTDSDVLSYEKVILIIRVSVVQDLHFINFLVSSHFQYISLCVDNTASLQQVNFTEYLHSLPSYSVIVYRSARRKNSSFEACVQSFFNVGFKHQAFFVIGNVNEFKFWSEGVQLVKDLKELPPASDEDIFFIRRNVALGFRHFKSSKASNLASYCLLRKTNKVRIQFLFS